MEGAGRDGLSLQEYIASMNKSTLPRVLQVCSGVYFQGSVYERSGSEVCLSTGDLLKVISVELQSVICEDISTNVTSELSLDHADLFKLVLEDLPFHTVEEMVGLMPDPQGAHDHFCFTCRQPLSLEGCRMEAGDTLTLLSVRHKNRQEPQASCRLEGHQTAPSQVLLPFTCHGEFYECDNGYCYTLRDIMTSPRLVSRRFRLAKSAECGGPLILSPVYQVQAIMHLRKEVVKFPSSLEVDVVDVTEQLRDITFVTPLTLAELAAQPPDSFPSMAEVLVGLETAPLLKCWWLRGLQKARSLVLHGCKDSTMVLASTLQGKKARRFFLLSERYGGLMRRRPREFTMVYELYKAIGSTTGLKVCVSKPYDAQEEGLDSLSVGDMLEVLGCRKMMLPGDREKQAVDVLICNRTLEADDNDEEDNEEICLPMYHHGHFVERIRDNKKYSLAALMESFPLPLDVKVAVRDAQLEVDPLADVLALRLEEVTVESVVLVSLPSQPDLCFELPRRWLNLTVSLTRNALPWSAGQSPELRWDTVTEVTEAFYYEFHKLTDNFEPPPPRPPKRKVNPTPPQKTSEAPEMPFRTQSLSLPDVFSDLTISNKISYKKSLPPTPPEIIDEVPPVIPRKPTSVQGCMAEPNAYVKTSNKSTKTKRKKVPLPETQNNSGSDHDYEQVEDMVRNLHENIMFY